MIKVSKSAETLQDGVQNLIHASIEDYKLRSRTNDVALTGESHLMLITSIEGATVEAKLLDNVKDRTILVFHKRRRKHSRKKNGHRQRHSKIQITKILSKDGKVIGEAKLQAAPKKAKQPEKEMKKKTLVKKVKNK